MDKQARRDAQIAFLKDNHTLQEHRIQALFQLMNIGDKESVDAIFWTLKNDPCQIVRHEAAFALGEMAVEGNISMLKDVVQKDPSAVVKHEALLALGTIADKSILPFLESFLSDKNELVSQSAKIAIQRLTQVKKPYRGTEEFAYLHKE